MKGRLIWLILMVAGKRDRRAVLLVVVLLLIALVLGELLALVELLLGNRR